MDNQHQKITGYRDLTEDEITSMNKIKALANEVGDHVEYMQTYTGNYDQRWVSIAKTQLQQGFMALTRAVAKPESF